MTCQECGQSMQGRSDKKYCSDHCRNSRNNKIHAYNNRSIRTTNSVLRKNRRILEILYHRGQEFHDILTLARQGFDFAMYTGVYHDKNGSCFYRCYEYLYQFNETRATIYIGKVPERHYAAASSS